LASFRKKQKGDVKNTLAVYEAQAGTFLAQWGKEKYRVPPLLKEVLREMPKKGIILDLGCGPGQDIFYLKKKGYHPIGLDGVWAFLKWARRKDPQVKLIYGDLRYLPIKKNRLDVIWAAASLIHVSKPDFRKALKGIGSLMNSGGILGATFAHGNVSGRLKKGWIPGRYVSRWLKQELIAAVVSSGWSLEMIKTVSNQERKGKWINLIARKIY